MAIYLLTSNGSFVAGDGTTPASGTGIQTIIWDGVASYTPPSGLNTPTSFTGQSIYQPVNPANSSVQTWQKTPSAISGTLAAISVVGVSLVTPLSFTVPGVVLGNLVIPAFSGAPPTSVALAGATVTAANTVLVSFMTTAALTVGSQTVNLLFTWGN